MVEGRPLVALDVMGADSMFGEDPAERMMEGATLAQAAGYNVVVVGDTNKVGRDHGLTIVHAAEQFTMTDKMTDFKNRKDASARVAGRLVREGAVAGLVSMGHSGGTVYTGHIDVGRIKGIKRGALAATIPDPFSDRLTVFTDVGANPQTELAWLGPWAQMAVAYSHFLGEEEPVVGYLGIGEEVDKGSDFDIEARKALEATNLAPGILSSENAQGSDLIGSRFQVIVADGATGNKELKGMEGVGFALLFAALSLVGNVEGGKEALNPLVQKVDPNNYGGGVLLGVDGVVVIGHGKAKPQAVVNSIRLASDLAERDIVGTIKQKLVANA